MVHAAMHDPIDRRTSLIIHTHAAWHVVGASHLFCRKNPKKSVIYFISLLVLPTTWLAAAFRWFSRRKDVFVVGVAC